MSKIPHPPAPVTAPKTWQKSKVRGLWWNNRTRSYYGRYYIAAADKFEPLETDIFEVAQRRHAKRQTEILDARRLTTKTHSGAASVDDFLTLQEAVIRNRASKRQSEDGLQESTREAYLNSILYVRKTWPELKSLRPDQITGERLDAWKERCKRNDTYRPPNAKETSARCAGNSASTFNKAVNQLRCALSIAVDRGVISRNPIPSGKGERKFRRVLNPHKPRVPGPTGLAELFDAIENDPRNRRWGLEAADLCRLIKLTGCRLGEATGDRAPADFNRPGMRLSDVGWTTGWVRIRGWKNKAADRRVPLTPDLKAHLEKMLARRSEEAGVSDHRFLPGDTRVTTLLQCEKSLARACRAIGCEHLTHHDLRDAYATTAIDKGIRASVLAPWFGHSDGGALLLRVYYSTNDENEAAQAALLGAHPAGAKQLAVAS